MELMDYVPFPALQGLSKTFIKIWQAVQQVSVSFDLLWTGSDLSDSNDHDFSADEPAGLSPPDADLHYHFGCNY